MVNLFIYHFSGKPATIFDSPGAAVSLPLTLTSLKTILAHTGCDEAGLSNHFFRAATGPKSVRKALQEQNS